MTDHLLEEIRGSVAILTMNRPDRRNAMSKDMLTAMLDSLNRLSMDDAIGCVVLTGAGNAFCAGGDVKAMADGEETDADTLEGKTQQLRAAMETSRLLHEMPKPTIAMVGGAAAGAGLSLALACEMRIVASSAKFTSAFAKVGYSGDFGGSFYLTHLVGTAKARELYYTAALVMADEALSLGMANHVFPDAELEAETLGFAEALAAGPRIAYRYMKRNLNAVESGAPLKDMLDMEALHHSRCGMTEDHQEAAKAFVEKRPPVFSGR